MVIFDFEKLVFKLNFSTELDTENFGDFHIKSERFIRDDVFAL